MALWEGIPTPGTAHSCPGIQGRRVAWGGGILTSKRSLRYGEAIATSDPADVTHVLLHARTRGPLNTHHVQGMSPQTGTQGHSAQRAVTQFTLLRV